LRDLVARESRHAQAFADARAPVVERFTPTSDGSRLDYSLVITDPESLTTPAELRRIWVYRPGEEVLPFNCTESTPP
jgi:hypothetical protein